MLKLNFDAENDILYIAAGDMSNSVADEDLGGASVFRDEDTNEITGFTIFGFLQKSKSNSLPELPVHIADSR
ncbi:MAG: hypothetical protein LBN97_08670 [Oscillospiraceae bacterium]|jgi:uncharacterized protein YuzE|nr:hypothetical protein [Oscillospiraceae bacterium]